MPMKFPAVRSSSRSSCSHGLIRQCDELVCNTLAGSASIRNGWPVDSWAQSQPYSNAVHCYRRQAAFSKDLQKSQNKNVYLLEFPLIATQAIVEIAFYLLYLDPFQHECYRS
jgi:hypothetical protein